jgi:predicted dehydrogenase
MKNKSNTTTRREFISKTGIAAAGVTIGAANLSAISCGRVLGANDKIRVGFIGIGNRGTQVMDLFRAEPDVEVAALCDVYQPYLDRDLSKVNPRFKELMGDKVPKMGENFPASVAKYTDYRKLLEDKSIDAVMIATPDHWHAIQTIDALKAGKHVYVEKPVAKTVKEGRAMIEAAKKTKLVVAVGLSRRGSTTYQKLAKDVPAGKIGKITYASGAYVSNMFPDGIGKYKPEDPPADFNWDMWLGPKQMQPYQYNLAPYMFRWWEEYDNQIANNGVHSLDLLRWVLNEKAPKSIVTIGGRYAVNDDRTIPDTMQTMFEFSSGLLVTYTTLEASSGSFYPFGMLEFRGTNGTLYAGGANEYKIAPTKKGQFQTWDKLMDGEEYENKSSGTKGKLVDGSYAEPTANLVRNFLDCIKSGKTPIIGLEEGHYSTNMAHLATISMMVKQRLEWDAEKEIITNSDEANKLLHYEYRSPWKL